MAGSAKKVGDRVISGFVELEASTCSNLQVKSWESAALELSLELRYGKRLRLSLGGDRHDLRSGGESRASGGGERGRERARVGC